MAKNYGKDIDNIRKRYVTYLPPLMAKNFDATLAKEQMTPCEYLKNLVRKDQVERGLIGKKIL